MVTRLLIVYFLILFGSSQATLWQSNVFAQQGTGATVKTESKGGFLSEEACSHDEILLKYVDFLSKESEKHRIFINNETANQGTFISRLVVATGVVVTILVSVLGWLSCTSADEVYRRLFENRFKNRFEKKLKSIEAYELRLAEVTDKANSYFRALARVIVVTSNTNPFDEKKLIGKNILWVDDKPHNILDYKMLLESLEVKVTLAETTEQTVKCLKDGNFDLIITNLGRLGDGGAEAGLNLLKKVGKYKIPIVIFTRPNNIAKYKVKAKQLGAYDIVSGISGILNVIVKKLAL